jgi:hypothetical protein
VAENAGTGQAIDLVASADPDTCTVSGKWRREGGSLSVTDSGPEGRIVFPVVVQGGYELTVAFRRTEGNDTVGIILPVADKAVLLGLGYWGNTSHGLDRVNGKGGADPTNPAVLKPAGLENNREYVAHARVVVENDVADIRVDLDGKQIIVWRGPPSALSIFDGWRLPAPRQIGLGVSKGAASFRSAQLVMLSGTARPLPRFVQKTIPAGQVVELLPLVDIESHARGGVWQRQGASLVLATPVRTACITIPAAPAGDYEFQGRLVRTSGDDTVSITFPVGPSGVSINLSRIHGEASGLHKVDDRNAEDSEYAVKPGRITNNSEFSVYGRVIVEGDTAQVTIMVDAKPLVAWKGHVSALSIDSEWRPVGAGQFAVGASNCGLVVRSLQLKMLTGEAKVQQRAAARGG